jgi:hypothetical protein
MWPVPQLLARGMPQLTAALAQTGFDADVGRKLYHWVRRAGLEDVRVTIHPLDLIAGAAAPVHLDAWRHRFSALAPFGARAFGSSTAYDEFVSAYLATLSDPDVLKYIVVFAVRGTRR